MTTSEFPTKLGRLEAKVSAQKGPFALFALFMREDVPDRWDLVISAPWISDKSEASLWHPRLSAVVSLTNSGPTMLTWPHA